MKSSLAVLGAESTKPMPERMRLGTVAIRTLTLVFVLSSLCFGQDRSDELDRMLSEFRDSPVWSVFKNSPKMIDRCAFKIAYEVKFNPRTDWPAYCNDFRETDVVKHRVKEIRAALASLDATKTEKEKIKSGKMWIGATPAMAKLAWGNPKKVNRTITESGTSEQWVFGGPSYLYFVNGKLTAIMN